jgi:hypothetical protein
MDSSLFRCGNLPCGSGGMDLCTLQRYKASRVIKCENGDFSHRLIELVDFLLMDTFQDSSKRLQSVSKKPLIYDPKGSFMIGLVNVIFRLGIEFEEKFECNVELLEEY